MTRIHPHPAPGANRAKRVVLPTLTLALFIITSGCKTAPVTDASLTTAVHSRITADGALANEPIQPSVQNGIVTLNGTVSSEAARSLAANDAAQVSGVRTVVNNLTVAPQQAAITPLAPLPQTPPPTPAPKPAPKPTPAKPANTAKKAAPETQPEISQYGAPSPPAPAPVERPTPQVEVAPPPPLPPPPPPPPAFKTVTIAAGDSIPIRITQTLDSATTQQGDTFTGVVAADVIIDGLVALPQGTPVTGRVSDVHEAAHYKGSSLLSIELTSINRKGERIPVVTETYSKEGEGRGKNTAEKVGGGAAVGAILGGILGGGKGAAIGAAAGGGVGAGANTVTRGQQVQIPSESLIRFKLTNAIAIRASTKDAAIRPTTTTPTPDDNQQRHPIETPPPQ